MSRSEIFSRHNPAKENLLMILHDLQNNNPEHYITSEDITEAAKYLNVTCSAVYGVVTYYSMFSLAPRGKFIIRTCSSPVCEMKSSEKIIEELGRVLSIGAGETTADGLFTLETTECLGQCDKSPCMYVNDRLFGNLSPESLQVIISKYRSGNDDF